MRRLAAFLCVTVMCLGACSKEPPPPEPEGPLYGGKPARHWIDQLKDLAPERRLAAIRALSAIGVEVEGVREALTGAAEDGRSPLRVRMKAAVALAGVDPDLATKVLIETVSDEDPVICQQGLKALGKLDGSVAIPVYVAVLQHDRRDRRLGDLMRQEAAEALVRAGPAAAPAVAPLEKLLSSDDRRVRAAAVRALGAIGEAAGPTAAALAGLVLADPAGDVRKAALAAIGRVGPEKATSTFAKALEGPHEKGVDVRTIRRRAAAALARIGPAAEGALPGLIGAVRDPDVAGARDEGGEAARDALLAAIRAIRAEAIPGTLVPALSEDLASEQVDVQMAAARLLGALGEEAEAAMPALALACIVGEKPVREECWVVLGCLREVLGEAIERGFATLLDHEDPEIRLRAAILVPGAKPEVTLPLIRAALRDEDGEHRVDAARSLQLIPQAAAPAVPDLLAALDSEHPELRKTAAMSLCYVAANLDEVFPPLSAAMECPHADVRAIVVGALSFVRDRPEEVLLVLRGALKDEDPLVRVAAAETLWDSGEAAEDAMASLVQALGDEERSVQDAAVAALLRIGWQAAPHLGKALESQSRKRVYGALRVFQAMRSHARDGAPALARYWLGCRDPFLSQEARKALELVGPRHAVGELIEGLKDDERGYVAEVLAGIGKPVVPDLVEALEHENEVVRSRAASTLGLLGRAAADAGPVLLEAWLRDGNENVEKAVRQIGLGPDVAIPILGEALRAETVRRRALAARALGWFGKENDEVVGLLTKALEDTDARVRLQAAGSLLLVSSRMAGPLGVIVKELESPDAATRLEATRLVERTGPPAADAVPALVAIVRDPEQGVDLRLAAVGALAAIGPAARAALPVLEEVREEKGLSPGFRRKITAAIYAILPGK